MAGASAHTTTELGTEANYQTQFLASIGNPNPVPADLLLEIKASYKAAKMHCDKLCAAEGTGSQLLSMKRSLMLSDMVPRKKWESSDPESAEMSFDVFQSGVNVEDMSVVTSRAESDYWIFTPVSTIGDGGHPLAGHRQFGLVTVMGEKSDTYTFYTRGVDRPFTIIDAAVQYAIFNGADKLWRAVMSNVVDYIKEKGGETEVGPSISKRLSHEEFVK